MKWWRVAQIILLALAVALTAYGAWRGEAFMVLLKGGNICLECIGLG